MPSWELIAVEPRGIVAGRDWRDALRQAREGLGIGIAPDGVALLEGGTLELRMVDGQVARLVPVSEEEAATAPICLAPGAPAMAVGAASAEPDTAACSGQAEALPTYEWKAVPVIAPRPGVLTCWVEEEPTDGALTVSLLHDVMDDAPTHRIMVEADDGPAVPEARPDRSAPGAARSQ